MFSISISDSLNVRICNLRTAKLFLCVRGCVRVSAFKDSSACMCEIGISVGAWKCVCVCVSRCVCECGCGCVGVNTYEIFWKWIRLEMCEIFSTFLLRNAIKRGKSSSKLSQTRYSLIFFSMSSFQFFSKTCFFIYSPDQIFEIFCWREFFSFSFSGDIW